VIGADTAFAKAEALAPACHGEILGFRRTTAAALQEPAGLLLQAKKDDSALVVYRLAAVINPSGTSLMSVGNLFESTGQMDSALAYYRKAVGTGGSDQPMTMARLRLANIYRQMDQVDSAATYFALVMHGADAAGDKDTRNSAALTLAVTLQNAQRYAEAIPVLRQSIVWGANIEPSRRLLATIYQATGQVDSAEAELRALGEASGARRTTPPRPRKISSERWCGSRITGWRSGISPRPTSRSRTGTNSRRSGGSLSHWNHSVRRPAAFNSRDISGSTTVPTWSDSRTSSTLCHSSWRM